MSIEDILKVHSIHTGHSLTIEEVNIITPALLYQKTSCEGSAVHQKEVSKAIPPIEQGTETSLRGNTSRYSFL